MEIDYICEITAVISNGSKTIPISVACPVFSGKTLPVYNGVAMVRVPFIDAIADKVKSLLMGWFNKGVAISIEVRQLPSSFTPTCMPDAKHIVQDIIQTLLNQMFYVN